MRLPLPVAPVIGFALLAGCVKVVHDPFAAPDAATEPDAGDTDADTPDALFDGPVDEAGKPLGKPCLDDSQCDDAIGCTADRCDQDYKRCRNTPDDLGSVPGMVAAATTSRSDGSPEATQDAAKSRSATLVDRIISWPSGTSAGSVQVSCAGVAQPASSISPLQLSSLPLPQISATRLLTSGSVSLQSPPPVQW